MGGTLRLGPGKHYPKGFIKLKIVEHVYNNLISVTTSDVREYLREEFNVREKTNIEDHLDSLKDKKYIKKVVLEQDQDNHWYPPDTGDHVPGLLSDQDLWVAPQNDKKHIEDLVLKRQEYCDTVVKLFNTQFFNETVKPQIIQTFCSAPPLLDECNTKFFMNLKKLPGTEADESALREFYIKALSESPTVMSHMYIPSPLIRAGLYAIQMNPAIYAQNAEKEFQENPDQYPFTADQLREVLRQVQSWKVGNHAPVKMFTSIEAFGLASVYIGMNIDHIQFPHIREKIDPILSDLGTNALLEKYLPYPFFMAENMKFLITLAAVWGAFSTEKR